MIDKSWIRDKFNFKLRKIFSQMIAVFLIWVTYIHWYDILNLKMLIYHGKSVCYDIKARKNIRNPSVEHRFCADGDFCGPKISQIPSYFQSNHKESTFEMARFWIFRNEISNKKISNDDHVAIDFLNLFKWYFKWKWFVKIWIKGVLLDCCFLFL